MWRRYVTCLVLFLVLVSLYIPISSGEDPTLELQVSHMYSGDNYFLYVNKEGYFDAIIIKPDPIDPNTTYTFYWDFDDTTDVDLDGVFDNDNETVGQHARWSFNETRRYNITCTLTDGTRFVKDVVQVTIRAFGVTRFDTNKDTYRPGENINVTWRIERGGDMLAVVLDGNLLFQVFNETGSLFLEVEDYYYLPSGPSIDTISFSFSLMTVGDYRLVATPYSGSHKGLGNETYVRVDGDPLYAEPVASIDVGNLTINVGASEVFSAGGSYDPDGNIVYYEWDLGDGTFAYGQDISHAFTEPGDYTIVLIVRDDDDLTASAIVTINVRPPEPPSPGDITDPVLPPEPPSPGDITDPVLPVMALIVIVAMAVAWSTEASKVALLGLGLPLYTKLRKEKVLDDFTRGRIYGYITANPGEHYNSIKRALDLPNGTFAHHLSVLEKEGHIKSRTDSTLKRYYPMDMKVPSSEGTLKHTQVLIMEVIRDTPGISQREVAAVLGLSSSTVGYHVEGLIERGYVRKERRGMGLRYYVTDLGPTS